MGKAEQLEGSWCSISIAHTVLYCPVAAEREARSQRRSDSQKRHADRDRHWYEACSLTGLNMLDLLHFVSLGDSRVTYCGVARGYSLYSRIRIKSTVIPGDDDNASVGRDINNGQYKGMLGDICVHELVSDDFMQNFMAYMEADPLHLSNWPLKYGFFFERAYEIPETTITFTPEAQEAKWKKFRIDMAQPAEIAEWNERWSKMIDDDEKNLLLMDLMRDIDNGMNEKDLIEHKWFMVLINLCGEGWHVMPNPRKHETSDCFIIRSNGAVLLVSMKTAIVRSKNQRSFSSDGKTREHCDVVIAFG